MKVKSVDMTEGKLLPKIIAFAIPVMLSGLFQQLFSTADMIVVGRFGLDHSIGAVGSNNAVINLLVNFFIGIATGTGVVTAHAIGEKDGKKVSETVHTAMPAAAICGLFLTLVGLFGSTWILENIMKTPADMLGQASLYLRIYLCGAPLSIIYNVGSAILRADGDSKRPLYFITLSGVVNVGLNLIFVVFFHMDVAGVALATVISQGVSAALVVAVLVKRDDDCKLYLRRMRIHKKRLIGILKIALPTGFTSIVFHISNVIIQSSVNSFGSAVVDGASAGHSLETFANTIVCCFSAAAQNFSAQNLGAKKYGRAVRSVFISAGCACTAGLILGPLFHYFSPQLLRIYLGDAKDKISYGVIRLAYQCRFYAVMGLMDTFASGLRGFGSAVSAMAITMLGACGFRIVWIYTVFQNTRTLDNLFVAYPISWTITFVAEFIAFMIVYKKIKSKDTALKATAD